MEIGLKLFLCINFVLSLFSFGIFLLGFMPTKSVLPGYATKPARIVNSTILSHKRLVILVIDALRTDFVYGEADYMTYTRKLIQQRETVPLVTKLQLPSVTLPRIKALTTGGIPSFADVLMNFDSPKLTEDNLLSQFRRAGKRIVFFGDDTWQKLFPDHFTRGDPTTSFFVSDYTEVDHNVSRHLDSELARSDWQVMVLHYLGLDHIGHLRGPGSSLVKPKLEEMDQEVQKIHLALKQQSADGRGDSLLLVCGDHGMADQGGHGGGSVSETTTPAVFISTKFAHGKGLPYEDTVVQQIDVTPTLASLFGLPIPRNNLGILIPQLFADVGVADLVRLYHNNAKQLWEMSEINCPHIVKDMRFYVEYTVLQSAADFWLKIGTHQQARKKRGHSLVFRYQTLLTALQQKVALSLSRYDLYTMSLGLISLMMILLVTVAEFVTLPRGTRALRLRRPASICSLLVLVLCVSVHLAMCTSPYRSDLLCATTLTSVSLQIAVFCKIIFLMVVVVSCLKSPGRIQATAGWWPRTCVEKLLLAGTILHPGSFMSSSFVEEEHQTWYFFTTTLYILALVMILSGSEVKRPAVPGTGDKGQYTDIKHIDSLKKIDPLNMTNDVMSEDTQHVEKSSLDSHTSVKSAKDFKKAAYSIREGTTLQFPDPGKWLNRKDWAVIAAVFTILALGRVARSWNQTGNKWLDQPDVGDWLVGEENKPVLSFLVILSMLVITALRFTAHTGLVRILFPLGMLGVYCFRAANQMFLIPETWPTSSKGTWEARWVYFIIFAILTKGVLSYRTAGKRTSRRTDALWETLQTAWILLMTLILKSHNAVLVAMTIVQEELLSQHMIGHLELPVPALTLWYFWMGQAAFFYQGNSNSVNTVDVSAGYIGLTSYQPVLIALLLTSSTYAGPVFWLISLVKTVNKKRCGHNLYQVLFTLYLSRCLPMILSAMVVFVNQFHLFIWSVFAPKLLYEGMFSVVTATLCISLTICHKFIA